MNTLNKISEYYFLCLAQQITYPEHLVKRWIEDTLATMVGTKRRTPVRGDWLQKTDISTTDLSLTNAEFIDWMNKNNLSFSEQNLVYRYKDYVLVKSILPSGPSYIISFKPTLPNKEYGLVSSSILFPTSVIPKLYLLEVVKLHSITPDIAHYNWLIDVINNFFTMSKDFSKNFADFIQSNKDTIYNIYKFIKQHPRKLGKGIDGIAFDIGDGKVLKVFTYRFAYDAAKKTQKLLHQKTDLAKTEVMIYDVGEFKDVDLISDSSDSNLYYYIIEKMKVFKDFSEQHPRAYHLFDIYNLSYKISSELEKQGVMEKLTQMANDGDENLLVILKRLIKYFSEKFNSFKEDFWLALSEETRKHLVPHWFEELIEEIIMKILTSREDLHQGNIGLTPYGKFRFFDSAI